MDEQAFIVKVERNTYLIPGGTKEVSKTDEVKRQAPNGSVSSVWSYSSRKTTKIKKRKQAGSFYKTRREAA